MRISFTDIAVYNRRRPEALFILKARRNDLDGTRCTIDRLGVIYSAIRTYRKM
jgi:hypothetical protein